LSFFAATLADYAKKKKNKGVERYLRDSRVSAFVCSSFPLLSKACSKAMKEIASK
jgi:hypothetical protein